LFFLLIFLKELNLLLISKFEGRVNVIDLVDVCQGVPGKMVVAGMRLLEIVLLQ